MKDHNIGKIPPQAIDVERSILGAMMTLPATVDIAKSEINSVMFYVKAHCLIYEAIISHDNADILTVTDKLRGNNQLEDIGGPYYLTRLTNGETFGNFKQWCAILKQKYTRRKAIEIGTILQTVGFDDTRDELDSFSELDKAHENLSDLVFGSNEISGFVEVAEQSLSDLDKRIERAKKGHMPGITTGIKNLDRITGGWIPGDLIVIAARPGMGKTALALHFLKTAANQGKQLYFFSLEMTLARLMDRLIVGGTHIANYDYKMGKISSEDKAKVKQWVRDNSGMGIFMDDRSMVTVDYIISKCRIMARKKKLDMVIIDYLQLMDMQQEKGATRDMAIGLVTRKLKAMAKELNVPVIALSQLNRAVETRSEKRPVLADLRESGNIEQDTDLVMFIYRPSYYGVETFNGKPSDGLAVIDIAKHRNGESNVDIECFYNESLTQFFDEPSSNMPF